MSLTKPGELGIIACPGGKAFAMKMIPQLKSIYHKWFDNLAVRLSKRYDMSKEELITKINLDSELQNEMGNGRRKLSRYQVPEFLIPVAFTRFANGEFKAQIGASVRGKDVYIIQDIENCYPLKFNGDDESHVLSINDHMMCLFVAIDAAMQASAASVTLVVPTYPYSRQHKKKGREGLTASWFGRMVEYMGVTRIITLDIHSKEVENTFNRVVLENLHASYQILKALMDVVPLDSDDLVIVSPDTGAVDRNKFYASTLNKPLAMLYKERDYSQVSKNAATSNITRIHLLGDVEDKIVLMADDLLGTGGTLINAMKILTEMGAKKIICAVSLPLFTGDAISHFDEAYKKGYFYRIIGTNAVYHENKLLNKEWYIHANIARLFARTISRLHHGRSVSSILDNRHIIRKLFK